MTARGGGKFHRAAAWSEVTFKEVYSKYLRPLHGYLLRRVRNHHDAEDLAAQVFAQALTHLDPTQATGSQVRAWLFTSARNASANHARSRRFLVTAAIEELPDEADSLDPTKAVLDEEQVERLLEAVHNLPEERRTALMLRFVEELSHAEIGDVLGRSEGSARVLIHRTLNDLRKEVS